jgi:hypothetical protein
LSIKTKDAYFSFKEKTTESGNSKINRDHIPETAGISFHVVKKGFKLLLLRHTLQQAIGETII